MNQKSYSFLEIKAKIESYCAYQERCHSEVEERLFKLGADSEQRSRLVSHLISYNFMNEERFAEAFVSGKIRIKRWGKNKIRMHLKQKKVSDYSIKKAFEEVDDELYFENLAHLAQRKYTEAKGNHFEKLQKTKQYLYNRGYESEFIFDELKKFS